ncbi:MAG: hypothetical protein Q8R95_00910 [Azonexus sp.]|nr:hypothetical protein [Azonexus sp.]
MPKLELTPLPQPTPDEIRAARNRVGHSQTEAGQIVSNAQVKPWRTWQGYEADAGKKDHRDIPLVVWAYYLLVTDQHPTMVLQARQHAKPPPG